MLQTIDRYEIRHELGRGGMATVYTAYDPRFDRDVAIKVLPTEFLHDPQFRARFEREARAIASLEHPAIVPVYDSGESNGRLFLVMRLMSGGSLSERVKRGPMAPAEVARILNRLAPALDAAHSQGLVHRDLKPANILFDQWGEPYISDFGIVKLMGSNDTALTVAGGIVGTPAYMSPEQVQAREGLDGRSDIYAIGCILFEMLAGKVPYKANTPIGTAFMHVNEPVPRILEVNAQLPVASQVVLAKALAKNRDDRYQKTVELSKAFQEAVSGVVPTAQLTMSADQTRIDKPPSPQPPPLKRPIESYEAPVQPSQSAGFPRWAMGLTAVLVLILCVGGAALAFSAFGDQIAGGGDEATPVVIVSDTPNVVVGEESVETVTATSAAVVEEAPATETLTLTAEPTMTATPTPALPPETAVLDDTWLRPADGMMMVYVPAGSFLMGSDPALDPLAGGNEQLHPVTLDAFWIDQTEVTNDMFAAFVAETGYVTTAEIEGDGRVQIERQGEVVPGTDWRHPAGPESDIDGQGNYPVLQVSWFDAQEYCSWAGGSLPTEAQWEYAARGPENRIYPWGNEFNGNLVNFCDVNCPFPYANQEYSDQSERLGPVATLPGGASWVGAFDMVGNAWEWVADWFQADYFEVSPTENPSGPETGQNRVLRGGSWYDDAPHVRAAQRGSNLPETRHALYGFRCSLPGN